MVEFEPTTRSCEPDRQVDARGQLCPMPATLTSRMLKRMQPGQLLEVLATDPLAEMDLAVLCEMLGHELLATERSDETLRILIRVSAGQRSGAD
ncbi:MAG: sulfurtransferase TusA family protein [Wenzhouxiangella sp.]|nr:MAG: sulfurtransferase TusA family protein [Wenzhouxiangella sp.]